MSLKCCGIDIAFALFLFLNCGKEDKPLKNLLNASLRCFTASWND